MLRGGRSLRQTRNPASAQVVEPSGLRGLVYWSPAAPAFFRGTGNDAINRNDLPTLMFGNPLDIAEVAHEPDPLR